MLTGQKRGDSDPSAIISERARVSVDTQGEALDPGMDDAIAMLAAGMTAPQVRQSAPMPHGPAEQELMPPHSGPKLSTVAPQRHRVNNGGSSDSSDSDSSDTSIDDSSDDGSDSGGEGGDDVGLSDDEGIWVVPHDPARPKRPQSAFFLYSAARRKLGSKIAPTQTADGRAPESRSAASFQKEIGADWRALPDAEKLQYFAAAEREKKTYERAMAAYKPPPMIQLPACPSAEEEKLYSKPLAAHRAAIERKKKKRRQQAQARAARQRKMRAEQTELAKRAAIEEKRRQAVDIARLAERNRIGLEAAEEEKKRKRKQSRRGWVLAEESVSDTENSEAACDSKGPHGNEEGKIEKRSFATSEAELQDGEESIHSLSDDGTAEHYVRVPMDGWRSSLDVWCGCLCQDVTGAWYEALVVDIRKIPGLSNGSTQGQFDTPGEVLIRYLAWDASFDEWVARDTARLSPRGTQQLAHMKPSEIAKLPEVTEEAALHLKPGTVVWLKWDSPGKDGHNEWFSAVIEKAVGGEGAATNKKKKSGLFGSRPKKKAEKSKLAKCWEGWYKLQFTSFICDDAFDVRLAANQHRLRCQF